MLGVFKKIFGGGNQPQLEEIIANGAYLIDVRSQGEFKTGSVKGAINIPVDTIGSQIKKLKGKQNIVVFCRSGARSSMAKSILERNGIQGVTNGKTVENVKRYLNK